MSLTLGNGFGNFKRPLNLRKETEETKNETKAPEIKGGLKAEKPQAVNSLEYSAEAPLNKDTINGPKVQEGGSNGNSTFGDLYGDEPNLPGSDPNSNTPASGKDWWKGEYWSGISEIANQIATQIQMGKNDKNILNDINNNFKS